MPRRKYTEREKRMLFADGVLLIVAAIWGGGFVAGKYALMGFAPVTILCYRFLGSVLLFGLLFHKRIRGEALGCIPRGMLLGLLQFSLLMAQMTGLQYTTPAKQSFLVSSYAIFTPFIAWLLSKVPPTKRDLAAAVIAVVGIGMISLNQSFTIEYGDLLSLLASVIFATQIVCAAKFVGNYDSIALTFYQFVSASVLAIVLQITSGATWTATNPTAIACLAYMVFINTMLAVCMQNFAQQYTMASHAALIMSLESVFAVLFAILFYKEILTMQITIGCVLVLGAIIYSKNLRE